MKPRLPEQTLRMLDRDYPLLMCQLEHVFGRQEAGWMVLETHRQGVRH